MAFLSDMDPRTGFLDPKSEAGRELATTYNAAEPFPHIVIEDFLPRPIVDMCLAEFVPNEGQTVFNSAYERLKRQYHVDQMSERPRNLFYAFNSLPFIRVLENITGIKGLIPDPYFMGAGFHEIQTGGHLSIHSDFNHHKLMNLERRINVLIYLNDDWSDDFGGQLELWDQQMQQCRKSVVPLANRCVIFNTTSNSNHGNPNPVNHPEGRSRKSIALYYYTATWRGDKRSHNTQFRVRPESTDEVNRRSRMIELIRDIAPPMLWRAALNARAKLTAR